MADFVNQEETEGEEIPRRKPGGFAKTVLTNPAQQREWSRLGGKAAQAAGTAHRFTTEEAREAGRKGGRATHAKRRAFKDDGTPNP